MKTQTSKIDEVIGNFGIKLHIKESLIKIVTQFFLFKFYIVWIESFDAKGLRNNFFG